MIPNGTRIELISMSYDPNPIPVGTQGTIEDGHEVRLGDGARDKFVQYRVKWDNGRTLMPCVPPDVLGIIDPR
jgi:hypothetical protein